ncbi:hypothetical protein MCOR25_010941 [Pyricularia grisea]|uniref:chitinase n=1 Tax=Pyricularia grisea TaxID=148305 RepID=A0A6P8BGL7_PYRGI|nr:uncharacterized protein PgNI_02495 [Pyricularia grisea]KAI6346959.1 hypothetical protein MCOR25_010941 [Pyricularia grisea]TLD15807.1 hypothetical protein PgNI_02495 [Pyricularia grisea]
MPSPRLLVLLALAALGSVDARLNLASQDNVATYWGQAPTQQGLASYCKSDQIDMIPLAFLNYINTPNIHFTNVENRCSKFAGTGVFNCPEIESDIKTCQSLNKTITLSIGGATYSEGGFATSDLASAAADKVWAMFGPQGDNSASVYRPFGSASVDGFDLDFETTQTSNLVPFARRLRKLIDDANANSKNSKKFLLTAAPQCVYPDLPMDSVLSSDVAFDLVMVQFYNNQCGADSFVAGSSTQSSFNFATWDNWAKSNNRNTKVFVGVPGTSTAAGTGYVNATDLKGIIDYSKKYSTFAGVMIWDVAQVWSNTGFLDTVSKSLDRGAKKDPPATTTAGSASSEPTSGSATDTAGAAQDTPQAPRKNAAGKNADYALGMGLWLPSVVFAVAAACLAL